MKLIWHLLLCWPASFGLMLITVGVLGTIFERKELMEITGGSGLSAYLFWLVVLSVATCIRYLLATRFK